MKQQIREGMSALLDDEADELDLQRILNSLDDDETAASWRRYHLASSAMRGELDNFVDVDLSARIRANLAEQSGSGAAVVSGKHFGSWMKPFASVAVAASVTAVILTGTQLFNVVNNGADTPPNALAVSGNVAPVMAGAQAVGFGRGSLPVAQSMTALPAEQAVADEMARRQLDAWLHNHVEHASLNTSSGLMPFARAAALQER